LLKVALNTIAITLTHSLQPFMCRIDVSIK
jgi:hypothetical protein